MIIAAAAHPPGDNTNNNNTNTHAINHNTNTTTTTNNNNNNTSDNTNTNTHTINEYQRALKPTTATSPLYLRYRGTSCRGRLLVSLVLVYLPLCIYVML